jgi:16S rRNA processing protein RimM
MPIHRACSNQGERFAWKILTVRRKRMWWPGAKPHGKGMLLAIEGVNERDAAAALIGSRLSVDKTTLPDLDDGTYYWFELIGLSIYTTQNQYLGTLESILPTGSNDVYVVRNGEEEILLPALASVVQVIDIDRRRMEVILPEGL